MATAKTIPRFIVEGKPGTPAAGLPMRMLKTINRKSALAHVAAEWLTARIAKGDDIEKAVLAGINTETVGEAAADNGEAK